MRLYLEGKLTIEYYLLVRLLFWAIMVFMFMIMLMKMLLVVVIAVVTVMVVYCGSLFYFIFCSCCLTLMMELMMIFFIISRSLFLSFSLSISLSLSSQILRLMAKMRFSFLSEIKKKLFLIVCMSLIWTIEFLYSFLFTLYSSLLPLFGGSW